MQRHIEEVDGGRWVAALNDVWRPGSYASEEAAP